MDLTNVKLLVQMRTTLLCERRAEIWRAESVEEIKIVNLTYKKKTVLKID